MRVQRFQPRFITPAQLAELSNLWHLAPVAGKHSRYDRLIWASGELAKKHPEVTPTGAYKDLDAMLTFGGR